MRLTSRQGVVATVVAGGVLLALLASHRSSQPTILGRWSASWAALMAAVALASAAVVVTLASPRARTAASSFARAALDLARRRSALLLRLAMLAAVLVHVALVLRFLPFALVASDWPLLHADHANHWHRVQVVSRALEESGRTWGWDPTFCAGYPEGTACDVDLKLAEILAIALARAGMPLATAFNATVLAFFLAAPLLLLATCRLFDLARGVTLIVVASGVLLWHSLPMLVLFNESGMFAFVFSCYWSLLAVAVWHRALASPTAGRALLLALTLAIAFASHILAVLLLAAPMAALLVRGWRRLTPRSAGMLALAIGAAVAANAWWLLPVLRFESIRVATTHFQPSRLSAIVVDLVTLSDDVLVLALLGAWGFVVLHREGGEAADDRSALACAGLASLAWSFFLAHLTLGLPLLSHLELSRFRIPLGIVGIIGLACGLPALVRRARQPGQRLLAVPALVLLASFALNLLTPRMSWSGGFEDEAGRFEPLAEWVERNVDRSGRVAFMDLNPGPVSGARLAAWVDREILGGPVVQVNLLHGRATLTRRHFLGVPLAELDAGELRDILRTYNVHWIVATTAEGRRAFERFPDQLDLRDEMTLRWGEPKAGEERGPQRIFDVAMFEAREKGSFVLEGSGRAVADLDRIEVTGARDATTLLAWHWLPTLRTEPPLPVRRRDVPFSDVGFIEVENGAVTEFAVVNRP